MQKLVLLTNSGSYTILQNRKEAATILGEEVQHQAYIDEEQLIEVGKFYGADYSCYATIQKVGKNFNIVCKFSDIKTGVSIGQHLSMSTERGEDDLIKVAHAMSKELASRRDLLAKSKTITISCSPFSFISFYEKIDVMVYFDDKEILKARGRDGFTQTIEDKNPGEHIIRVVANVYLNGKDKILGDAGGTYKINTLENEYFVFDGAKANIVEGSKLQLVKGRSQKNNSSSNNVSLRPKPTDGEIAFYFAGYTPNKEAHGDNSITVYLDGKLVGSGTISEGFSFIVKDSKPGKHKVDCKFGKYSDMYAQFKSSSFTIDTSIKSVFDIRVTESNNTVFTIYSISM